MRDVPARRLVRARQSTFLMCTARARPTPPMPSILCCLCRVCRGFEAERPADRHRGDRDDRRRLALPRWSLALLSVRRVASGVPARRADVDAVLRRAAAVRAAVPRSALAAGRRGTLRPGDPPPRQQPVAGNLSRSNPGGGFASGGGVRKRQVLRSDYLLVRLGRRQRLDAVSRRLRGERSPGRRPQRPPRPSVPAAHGVELRLASRIMADSTRYNLGSMTRTVNIPTLALMFLHPDVRERFEFTRAGDETIEGRAAWRLDYRESQRPTLIKTTRGRDLPASGTGVGRTGDRHRPEDAMVAGRPSGASDDHDHLPPRPPGSTCGCRRRWRITTRPRAKSTR